VGFADVWRVPDSSLDLSNVPTEIALEGESTMKDVRTVGIVLFASHDQRLLETIATQKWLVTDRQVIEVT
jgi:hypothetical protein